MSVASPANASGRLGQDTGMGGTMKAVRFVK